MGDHDLVWVDRSAGRYEHAPGISSTLDRAPTCTSTAEGAAFALLPAFTDLIDLAAFAGPSSAAGGAFATLMLLLAFPDMSAVSTESELPGRAFAPAGTRRAAEQTRRREKRRERVPRVMVVWGW